MLEEMTKVLGIESHSGYFLRILIKIRHQIDFSLKKK